MRYIRTIIEKGKGTIRFVCGSVQELRLRLSPIILPKTICYRLSLDDTTHSA